MRPKALDDHSLIGRKFGMLTILERLPNYKCLCSCDCGAKVVKLYHGVKSGKTQTCGCSKGKLISERRAIHGDARTSGEAAEHAVWRAMLQRCFDRNCEKYPLYGGRGITVCDEWKSYPAFLSYVGRRPTPTHSLDRFPNMNGNYEPGNVRWATRKEQARNTRTNLFLTAFGKTLTMAEWAEVTGIRYGRIAKRIRFGWLPERALSQPPRKTTQTYGN